MASDDRELGVRGLLEGIADFPAVAREIVEKKETTVSVLIVDDEPWALSEMTECLSERGIPCFGATSASEALELVDGAPDIGIVVTDLKMPGMDGMELVRRLRGDPTRKIECAMISGQGTMGDVQRAMHEGVREFLTKPLDPERLVRGVERLSEIIAQRDDRTGRTLR